MPTVVVDCAAVFTTISRILHARHPKNPGSGTWRSLDYDRWPYVLKTKAHRCREQAEREDDLHHWLGNDYVDKLAKAAAWWGSPPRHHAENAGLH